MNNICPFVCNTHFLFACVYVDIRLQGHVIRLQFSKDNNFSDQHQESLRQLVSLVERNKVEQQCNYIPVIQLM